MVQKLKDFAPPESCRKSATFERWRAAIFGIVEHGTAMIGASTGARSCPVFGSGPQTETNPSCRVQDAGGGRFANRPPNFCRRFRTWRNVRVFWNPWGNEKRAVKAAVIR